DAAKGQCSNRFEWRKKVANYQQVQSDNMNPWSAKAEAQVAAYRWSELQAMVLGTAYLQGHMLNHKKFSIQSVEDSGAYISKRKPISSAGDIIEPERVHFLWNELRPVIQKLGCLGEGTCYGKAVAKYLKDHCGDLPEAATKNIYSKASYDWLLKGEKTLRKQCDVPDVESFINYFTETFGVKQHSEFIKRYLELQGDRRSALITHLGEGRRLDPYNWTEFQVLRLAGLIIPGVSFIHGVGLRAEDFKTMAQNDMGLVWSPYSNFLLYGETVDVEAAKKAGVTVALGSDWTPTGSKGVLEELKLARNYVLKSEFSQRLFSDQELYYMVTKYPAKIMNHYGFEKKGEHGVGTLQVGAMGTLIATRSVDANPYTNLVAHVHVQDINLVVIDGTPVYGNKSYLQDLKELETEVISEKVFTATPAKDPDAFPAYGASAQKTGQAAAAIELGKSTRCDFNEPKLLVIQESEDYAKKVKPFISATKSSGHEGLNLDTYSGIVRYLGVALLSQSKNANAKSEHAPKYFPPLYSCDDPAYTKRLTHMVLPDGNDESDQNAEDRTELRLEMGLYSAKKGDEWKYTLPHEQALTYQLPHYEEVLYLEKEEQEVVVDVSLNTRSQEFADLLDFLTGK
ncbi:MAG: amidohydrolase family protein, partial [Bdellovibrionales bacterium]|nr:amidohydrolase family protein [Bdellovibrionales bacterium]